MKDLAFRTACVIALSTSASAGAVEHYRGTGVVGPGPCAGALLFTSGTGERFEVDRSRVNLELGPLTVVGVVFRRHSVCRKFPWLDVKRVDAQISDVPLLDAVQGTVTLTIAPEQLAAVMPTVEVLARLPAISSIRLRVVEAGDLRRITDVLAARGAHAAAAFEKVNLEVGSFSGAPFAWITPARTYTYTSIAELRHALGIH